MADDNLLAGLAGFTSGIQSVLTPYLQATYQDKLLRRRQSEDDQRALQNRVAYLPYEEASQRRMKDYETEQRMKTLPYETDAKIKVANSQPFINIFDGSGNVIGQMPRGSKQLTGGAKGTLDKKQQQQINDAKSALSILNRLESDFQQTPSGLTALGSRGVSLLTGGAMGDKGQRTYEDSLNSNSAKFYRSYTGDTRLSDQDAQERAYKLLPSSYFDKKQGASKFTDLKTNVLLGVRPLLEKAGISEDQFIKEASNFSTPYQNSPSAQKSPTGPAISQSSKSILEKYGIK